MTAPSNVYAPPEKSRSFSIIVYDLRGGPFPERAATELELAVDKVAHAFDGLAITVIRE